ncbi:MAG: flagellar basal-body MS-ring/collar protein FliF [Alteripontixanthobacter sp.]
MASTDLAGTSGAAAVPPAMGGNILDSGKALLAQPAIRKALPAIGGLGALAVVALLWMAMSTPPQRTLYSSLGDAERASVVEVLDGAGIDYAIDNSTGMVSVAENDLYRARMLVASDGALASPETGAAMLDSIPLGASRTLEGERLKNVRERELMMTIAEIDAVESVRVHLAQPQRSAFVRDNAPPSASVMLRLARGRSLSDAQVSAIVNLVAGSVPGMATDEVRVADQHGNLLSADGDSGAGDMLKLQANYEDKLRAQIDGLLVPMLGAGNFSSEVQVELDNSEQTSARESYDKDGVVRSETEMRSTRRDSGPAGGIPGVLANTPPADAVLEDGAPQGGDAGGEDAGQTAGETSARRTYELGREVAVTSNAPGGLRRLSVAVALSREALDKIKPATAEQVEKLVAAAVGADPERGDTVAVIAGTFEPVVAEETPFYEASWFAAVLRNAVALIAVILALLFGVRPLVRALKREEPTEGDAPIDGGELLAQGVLDPAANSAGTSGSGPDTEALREQVALARSLAAQQPDRAATALRRMLAEPAGSASA